ncbi:unnamed protein product [Hydatigera taeniaeformis]|uniref:AXH domain-containing protein n=1 Tax=Hydatigena taeniaeformis TaxID=6205 RepID=A0A0R3WJL7_HYDTA|nr:unnamed protein product [Hydatigera taeniaeformis]
MRASRNGEVDRQMTLFPHKAAGSSNQPLHLAENLSSLLPNSILTPEQIIMVRALTISCGLFAPLLSHCRRKKSLQSILPAKFHPLHHSDVQRPFKSSSRSRGNAASTFQPTGKVRLPDGTVQKIESIRLADFLRTAAPINAESLLQWCRVEQIFLERPLASDHRELMKIRFSLNPFTPLLFTKGFYNLSSVITYDHICNREQPYFVRSHGWSSCDPRLTQTRCGLRCRQLSVGDFCLAIIPSEIAKSLSHSAQVSSTSGSCMDKVPPLTKGLNEDTWSSSSPAFQNCDSRFNSSPTLPQQPLNLKKESGAVPTYFTAASLAESPFKEKSLKVCP